MSRILFVVSGADHWTLADGTEHPSGFWAEEVVAPMRLSPVPGGKSSSPHRAALRRPWTG